MTIDKLASQNLPAKIVVPNRPPRASLVLRIGVTGHRLERLEPNEAQMEATIMALATKIGQVIEDLSQQATSICNPLKPTFRLISALAEGADQIAAEEALKRQWKLQCPLPFFREVYRDDFDSDKAKAKYEMLLNKASAVLELPGSRRDLPARLLAYESAGRIVLSQCDILLAIWDGNPSRNKGGTDQMVREARSHGIPIIWLRVPDLQLGTLTDEEEPKWQPIDLAEFGQQRIRQILLPSQVHAQVTPSHNDSQSATDVVQHPGKHPVAPQKNLEEAYFAERRRHWMWGGFLWKTFRDFIIKGKIRIQPRMRQSDADWDKEWAATESFPQQVRSQVDGAIKEHYVWADNLASYYANVYRSAIATNYLLAAFAVFLALAGYALGWTEHGNPYYSRQNIWIVAEGVVIATILGLTLYANFRRWHDRYIDYRLLAESIRLLRFLMPLGRTTPLARVPDHQAYGDPRGTWVYWHFQSIQRSAGLVSARFDEKYLQSCHGLIYHTLLMGNKDKETNSALQIKGQVRYHGDIANGLHKLNHRMHNTEIAIFGTTFLICLIHLSYHAAWLTLLAAGLPALGAALAGIHTHGEFTRVEHRARAMEERLSQIARRLDNSESNSLPKLAKVADEAATCLITEALDWRIVFSEHPIPLP